MSTFTREAEPMPDASLTDFVAAALAAGVPGAADIDERWSTNDDEFTWSPQLAARAVRSGLCHTLSPG